MIQPTSIHPITEFKRNTPEFLKRLRQTGLPEVLTIEGRGEIVVQEAAAYQRLVEAVDRAEALHGIRQGLADIDAGRLTTLDDFERKLRRKSNARRKR
jgi:predicted transcriptional regulator